MLLKIEKNLQKIFKSFLFIFLQSKVKGTNILSSYSCCKSNKSIKVKMCQPIQFSSTSPPQTRRTPVIWLSLLF